MTKRILLAISNPVQRETIKGIIEDFWDNTVDELVIDGASSAAEARLKLDEPNSPDYDLFICHSRLAPTRKEPVSEDKALGFDLIRELDEQHSEIPAILISFDNKLLNAVQLLDNARVVVEGEESMDEDLKKLTRKYLGRNIQNAPKPTLHKKLGEIDIWIQPEGQFLYYSMVGIGFRFHQITPTPITIDTKEIEQLIRRSHNVGQLKDWKPEFADIGKAILRQLFDNNSNFKENYRRLLDEVKREENIQVRFYVNEGFYPLALEALIDEEGQHLMLLSPIFRSVDRHSMKTKYNEVLFIDDIGKRPPVNCLIIAADASGKVTHPGINGGQTLVFQALEKVMEEATDLHDFLEGNQEELGINRVKIIRHRQGENFKDELDETLGENQWDLVHYAGHSYFDRNSGKGYLFYPGPTGPEPEESEVFSLRLRSSSNTQFIYLSSCESSGADFVLSLARQHIPAVIGFRWEIEDEQAADHAEIFYRKLFGEKKALPYAFLETRRAMFKKYSEKRIWAAGMLIIQGN